MGISVIVNGSAGRMGQESVKAIEAAADLKLVGQCGRDDDVIACAKEAGANVVVDFTLPECVFDNTARYIEAGLHPVIGATGLTPEQIQTLQQLAESQQLGGVIAPNFSIAVILMMRFACTAVRYYPDAEIIEYHHQHKVDAPSGTAIKTAQMMAQAKASGNQAPKTLDNAAPARGECVDAIPVHSVRLPGLVAHQAVVFGGQGETLTLRQDTIHREAFMPGVLLACREVVKLKSLVYGLEHLLDR